MAPLTGPLKKSYRPVEWHPYLSLSIQKFGGATCDFLEFGGRQRKASQLDSTSASSDNIPIFDHPFTTQPTILHPQHSSKPAKMDVDMDGAVSIAGPTGTALNGAT